MEINPLKSEHTHAHVRTYKWLSFWCMYMYIHVHNPFSREMNSSRPYARFYITARRYREPSRVVIDNPPRRPRPLNSSARLGAQRARWLAKRSLTLGLLPVWPFQLMSHPVHHNTSPTSQKCAKMRTFVTERVIVALFPCYSVV